MSNVISHLPAPGKAFTASRDDVPGAASVHVSQQYRSEVVLLTVFWAYVTATNLLVGISFQMNLASIGVTHVFADATTRLAQHLILFPALLGFMWLSRRIGWQPLWRAIPLQLICAILFSALANPALELAAPTTGTYEWRDLRMPGWSTGSEWPLRPVLLWVGSISMYLINYVFGLVLVVAFDFYRRYRDSEVRARALESSLASANLAALRTQLSPHTLFNLLHTISGHVSWDPAIAQSMIAQLGDLLRRSLGAAEHELTTLREELQFARLYLQLQQRRFADRLVLELPDGDAIPSVWVPSLILQPLIENAVVHGLARSPLPVTVRVEIAADAGTLILRVVNSMPSTPAAPDRLHAGIGLKNIRERLAIQFGGVATCQAGRAPSGEWIAELRIPVLPSGEGLPDRADFGAMARPAETQ